MTNIKQASIEDLDLIVPLFDAYRVFYKKESDLGGAESFIKQRLENNESTIFLAFDESQNAVGFIQLYPLFSSTRMSRLWLLNDLYIDPSARRKGLAKSLLDQAKQYCLETKASGFFLETAADNIEGNSLYPAAGMTLNHDHNFYYWDVNT